MNGFVENICVNYVALFGFGLHLINAINVLGIKNLENNYERMQKWVEIGV